MEVRFCNKREKKGLKKVWWIVKNRKLRSFFLRKLMGKLTQHSVFVGKDDKVWDFFSK